MKSIKYLFLLLFMGILLGCGEEDTDDTIHFQTIDNSELSHFYNSYGYYGEDVIFGEKNIVGEWALYDTDSDDVIYSEYYDDAEMKMENSSIYTYGVSKDGLTIKISTGEKITITTSTIYKKEEDEDCYRVKVIGTSRFTADMCFVD